MSRLKPIILFILLILSYQVQNQSCPNCQLNSCNQNSQCSKCISNYQLNDQGFCTIYTPIAGCKIYSSSGNHPCTSCQLGYLISFGRCLRMIENCRRTNNINICEQCNDGFQLVDQLNCFPKQQNGLCPKGSLPRQISQLSINFCDNSFRRNCLIFQYSQTSPACVTCQSGFNNVNGVCLNITVTRPNTQCQKYQLSYNNVCYTNNINNCFQKRDALTCKVCNNQFFLNGGLCNRPPKLNDIFCNVLDKNQQYCTGCNFGYYLNSYGFCVKNFLFIQSCKRTQNQKCVQCYQGFTLDNSKCFFSDRYCINIDAQNACTKCSEGFKLNPTTKKCQSTTSCLRKNPTNGLCDQCSFGFQRGNDGTCFSLPINCKSVDRNANTCLQCSESRYVPFISIQGKGICTEEVINCQQYNSIFGNCQICKTGFELDVNRQCKSPIKNCKDIDQTNNQKCKNCDIGYHLDKEDGLCYKDVQKCEAYGNKSICLQCQNPHYLYNGNCFINDPNCEAIDTDGNCLACTQTSGLTPFKDKCVFYDPYCLSYDKNGLCIKTFPSNIFSKGQFNLSQISEYQNFIRSMNNLQSGSTTVNTNIVSNPNNGGSSTSSSTSTSSSSTSSSPNVSNNGLFTSIGQNGSFSSTTTTSSSTRVSGSVIITETNITTINITKPARKSYNFFFSSSSLSGNGSSFSSSSGLSTASLGYSSSASLFEIGSGLFQAGGIVVSNGYAGVLANSQFGIQQWDLNGRVIQCKQGYVRSSSGFTCNFQTQSCITWGSNGKCLFCQEKYDLNENNQCILRSNNLGVSCISIDSNGLCALCAQNYKLIKNRCFYYKQGQLIQAGYYLHADYGIKWTYDFNCISQQRQNQCKKCASNDFTLLNGRCVRFIVNCKSYSQTGLCSTCNDGYILKGGMCRKIECPSFQVSNNILCGGCPSGFTYKQGLCINSLIFNTSVTNCKIFDINYQCKGCARKGVGMEKIDYYLDAPNLCKKIQIDQCLLVDSNTKRCTRCNIFPVSYTIFNDICVFSISNCISYSLTSNVFTSQCVSCSRGFEVWGNICQPFPYQCDKLSPNTGKCQACKGSYVIFQQSDQQTVNKAIQQRNQFGSIFSSNTTCIKNCSTICIRQVSNCSYYDDRGRCIVCNRDYILRYNTCQFQIPYCQQPKPNQNKCLRCKQGFRLNSEGRCQKITSNCKKYLNIYCIQCQIGYYLDSSKSCTKNPINCLIYNYNKNQCEQCINENYYLNQGICKRKQIPPGCKYQIFPCTQCKNGLILTTDNRCQATHCSIFNGDGFCIQCQQFFEIFKPDNICIPKNCQIYDPRTTNCISCTQGFKLNPTLQYCIPLYCKQLSAERCIKCQNYRYPDEFNPFGRCLPFNCQNISQVFCTTCSKNFRLDPLNGVCISQNCAQYIPENGRCLKCLQTYNLNAGICTKNPTDNKCLNYLSSLNRCLKCIPFYEPDVNGDCRPVHCQITSGPFQCAKCFDGYILTEDKLCKLIGCQRQVIPGTCQLCIPGFTFDSNRNPPSCIPSNCQTYSPVSIQCLECLPDFTLDKQSTLPLCKAKKCKVFNLRQICTTCIQGYQLSNNACIPSNCILRSEINGQCLFCSQGYYLNFTTGTCQSSSLACSQFKNNQCITCIQGFRLMQTSKLCVRIIPGCKSYAPLGCGVCEAGFEVCKYRCAPKNCQNVSSTNFSICDKCMTRFELTPKFICKPLNCLFFDDLNWFCNACEDRYSLINSQYCLTKNCSQFDSTNNRVCTKCSNGFQLNRYGLCVFSNCQTPEKDSCQKCNQGWRFIGSTCTGRNCLQYNPVNGQCIKCGSDQRLINGTCVSDNCLAKDINNKCIGCVQWFQPVNGVCVSRYCKQFNIVTGICADCYPNFVRDGTGRCKHVSCMSYSPASPITCQQCQKGYTPTGQYCTLNFCEIMSLQTATCQKCKIGFAFNSNGNKCQPSNCIQLNQDFSKCAKCSVGYKLDQNLCKASFCSSFIQQTYNCKVCQLGFSANFGICLAQNCQSFNSNTNGCEKCVLGYSLQPKGFCKVSNCQTYNSLNFTSCLKCLPKYELRNNLCSPNFCKTTSNDYSSCVQCKQGFLNDNGTCIARNCQSYSPSLTCLKCTIGFRLTPDNICVRNSTVICPVGRYFKDGSCLKIPLQSCNYVLDDLPEFCLECVDGFYLVQGLCYSLKFCQTFSYLTGCIQCKQNSVLENKICKQKNVTNCIEYNFDGSCKKCNPGYMVRNSQCVSFIQNCLQYDKIANNGCKTCIFGYKLNNGLCYKDVELPPYCLATNTSGKCISCAEGYKLFEGLCYNIIINCNLQVKNSCDQCFTGYTYQNGLCIKQINNCLIINSKNDNLCDKCVNGYVSISGKCNQQVINCQKYSQITGQCLKCISLYYLNNIKTCQKLPLNCLQSNQFGQCTKCATGFIGRSDGVCVKIIENCAKVNQQNQRCVECINNYYVNMIGQCSQIPNNCQLVNSNGVCTQCLPGFTQLNGLCFKIIINCANYNKVNGICLNCNQGYYLNTQGLCQKLPINCYIANSNGVCLTCANGYILSNNLCLRIIANCDNVNSETNLCLICNKGYYVNNQGFCTILPQNCLQANPSGRCISCISGYKQTQNGLCIKQIPNCKTVNQDTNRCSQCVQGYYLSASGQCKMLPSNCLQANVIGSCLRCIVGFDLQNNICIKIDPNCQKYDPLTGLCIECQQRFYLKNNVCYANPDYCLNFNPTQLRCTNCANGYNLNSQYICVKVINNCQIVSSANKCSKCTNGFYIDGNGNCQVLPPSCIKASLSGSCIDCLEGYENLGGICFKKIDNCRVISQITSFCDTCNQGYYVNSQGLCKKLPVNCVSANVIGSCTNCILQFQLQNGICIKVDPNCEIYNPQTGYCLSCLSRFYLSNNKCLPNPVNCFKFDGSLLKCIECVQGFQLVNNLCVRIISNCQRVDNNVCAFCNSGYYVNSQGLCSKLPNNCLTANPLGSCLTCLQTYKLTQVNGIALCVKDIQNCQSVSFVNDRCQDCQNGYYITSQGLCQKLPPNCASANSNGNCLSCIAGYDLINNLCVKKISNCQNVNPTTNLCTFCSSGYYINAQGFCIQLPRNCGSANFQGTCLTCIVGYKLNENKLCVKDILNCFNVNFNTEKCQICSNGFYINSLGLCIRLPENCLTANFNGACLTCIQGYRLSNNLCIKNIQNCQQVSQINPNICAFCTNGYYITSQGICLKLPENCISANNLGYCTRCIDGFQVFNNLCVRIIINCISYNPQNGFCVQCNQNYYINSQGSCSLLPQNCQQANLNGQCLRCLPSYTLKNKLCVRSDGNCLSYDPISNICVGCITNYYLNNINFCIQNPPNCVLYSFATQRCTQCISGFSLNSEGFCIRQISNCLLNGPNGCLRCNFRYFLLNNLCNPYIAYCVNVDLLGNCLSCCFGSTLQNNICVPNPSTRSLNCDSYDFNSNICNKCNNGYLYCSNCAICLKKNENCQQFLTDGQNICIKCRPGFMLIDGDCINPPPGIAAYGSSGINECFSGYQLSGSHCYRNISSLSRLSQTSGSILIYSSSTQSSFISASSSWKSSTTSLNQYFGMRFSGSTIIQGISLKGSSNGFIRQFILQFRNSDDKPYVCWNGCERLIGNVDSNNQMMLRFDHPLIASQIRIYALSWNESISGSLQCFGSLI